MPGARVSAHGGNPPADVVLVGLGGAGGIAAHVLTRAGLEVVALEAGPGSPAPEAAFDEIANEATGRLSLAKAAHEIPTFRDREDGIAGAAPWPMLMVNAVGGSTVHYPGLSARLQPWNFTSRTSTLERYGAGALPPGTTLADWPLRYEELEPYYDLVERAIGVSGRGGNVNGLIDDAGNPFEGARTREYPLPPLRRTGWTELMSSAARCLGWHPFPAPAAINSVPHDERPACTYCGFCTDNICHNGARGSTDVTVIRRAQATGLLRIESGARAVRVEVGRQGLVTGVTYIQQGREEFQPARVVLLAVFTYENVRLLLLSTSRAYPRGLSNNHGAVGKHYMAHVTPFAWGSFPGKRLRLFTGPWSQATCVEDWNADRFDHAGLGFVGGGMLTAAHELKPIAAARIPVPPSVPRWGSAWKAWLRTVGRSVGCVGAQLECPSYEWNVLDLDPLVRDPSGLPVIRVTFRTGDSERRGSDFLRQRLEEWLLEAGAAETWSTRELVLETRHCYGGTRMGDAPESAVVDRWGLSHETPNLGVLGSSVFPTTGGVNPTLTLQALAWRTAQRIVDDWAALPVPRDYGRIE
jgi:gluconate 2-dehydrogenase alpha chain